jgi:hypothetical protein
MRKLRGCSQMRSLLKALDGRRSDTSKAADLEAAQHVQQGAVTDHRST